ncbi:sulfotransferase family protein [Saccharothrix isguenensis]
MNPARSRASSSPGPLLVLAAGQRCGSTLVQRILSSHPDVLIWGEHAGQLRTMLTAVSRLHHWTRTDGERARVEYARRGYQSFMANLVPDERHVDLALKALLTTLFAEPAAALSKSVWGFKEVRYGLPEASGIRAVFPGSRVVHLVRDPRDILRSLDVWERTGGSWRRRDTEIAIADWQRVAWSFLHVTPAEAPHVLRVRYEDFVEDPRDHVRRIAEHCSLDPDDLDLAVLDRKIHTDGPQGEKKRAVSDWSALSPSLKALLDDDAVREVASACGYDL